MQIIAVDLKMLMNSSVLRCFQLFLIFPIQKIRDGLLLRGIQDSIPINVVENFMHHL